MLTYREIINPWNGMEGYNCYGCCPTNPLGAQMRFFDTDPEQKEGEIMSVWQPTQNHQSWINTLHGGLQATLLDEVCGWVVFAKLKTSGVTAEMNIRYKKAVSTIAGPLIVRAELLSFEHRLALVEGQIWVKRTEQRKADANVKPSAEPTLPAPLSEDYELGAVCQCKYFTLGPEQAAKMGYREPTYGDEQWTVAEILEKKIYQNYRTLK